ncbi:MAG: membrane fusion protein (multidrug efflux system) [Chlamydiales bacterium]|jgi:membrane fusion protein (multidrug efflux system)
MRGINPGACPLSIVAVLGLLACGSEDEALAMDKPAAAPPSVVVVEVTSKDVPVYRDFVARTSAVNTVEVQARVEAVLMTQTFEEGKPVAAGDRLYELDDRTYVANVAMAEALAAQAAAHLKLAREQVSVRAAEAGLVRNQANLKKALQDVARLEPLAAKDAVPRQDLDTALAAQEVAQAEVDAQQATLENARIQEEVGLMTADAEVQSAAGALALAKLDLEYCTITSPIDGLVGRTGVDVGNLVGRGEATPLVTISSIDPIYVTFSISEAEYLDLMERRRKRESTKGTAGLPPIELLLANDSIYEHEGQIAFGDRAVDELTGTLTLIASFPNPSGVLRPGQFGRCRLQVGVYDDAVLVPQRAIIEQQGAKFVYVVGDDSIASLRGIQVVERSGSSFVVTGGIESGERVILEGQLKARPGSPVNPMDKPVSSEPAQEKE